MNKLLQKKNDRGMTLLIAVLTASLLLSISLSIFNIALKELLISSSGRDSHTAFYSADGGIECALYWQFRGAFSTTTPSTIKCLNNSYVVGGGANSNFTLQGGASDGCAYVTVNTLGTGSTTIESRGYNTCQTSNRKTERAIRVKY